MKQAANNGGVGRIVLAGVISTLRAVMFLVGLLVFGPDRLMGKPAAGTTPAGGRYVIHNHHYHGPRSGRK